MIWEYSPVKGYLTSEIYSNRLILLDHRASIIQEEYNEAAVLNRCMVLSQLRPCLSQGSMELNFESCERLGS